MILLLVAGIVFLLAGAASIIVGVPVKEFSFGNTLILSGVIGFCTGALLLGLSAVIRELRSIGSGLGTEDIETDVTRAPGRTAFPQPTAAGADSDALFPGDRSEPSAPPQPLSPAAEPAGVMPWQDEAAARDRLRQRAAAPLEIKPPPPPVSAPLDTLSSEPEDEQTPPKRRNLLFASSRRERERAAQAGSEAPAGDLLGEEQDATSRMLGRASGPQPGATRRRLRRSGPACWSRRQHRAARRCSRSPC